MDTQLDYRHSQNAPWFLLLTAMSGVFFVAAWLNRHEPVAPVALVAAGALMALLATSFHHLTVIDQGDRIAIQFGPLPLFRKGIRYADMRAVEISRSLVLDGWGIHYSVRGGWIWNIWGRQCVAVHHGATTTWVGTDDAENLVRFLESKIAHNQ